MKRTPTTLLAVALAASAALGAALVQAQTTLVSNTFEGFSVINVGARENGSIAQQFTTGSNASGYEVSSVELYVGAVNYTGTETMTWRIHEYDFFATGLRGPLVATLSTPSGLTANAVNVFTAPSGTILKPSTRYLLNIHSTGDAAEDAQIGVIADNGESGLSDWRIEDAFRLLGGLYGPGFSIRFAMKGTVRDPFTASLGSAEFYVEEHPDWFADLTYRFDLELTEAVAVATRKMRDNAFAVTNGRIVGAKRIHKERRTTGGVERTYSNHWRLTVLPINNRNPVTVRLRGDRDCSEAGALCGAVDNPVTNSPELTLHYPDLTMNTENLPRVALLDTTARENDEFMSFKVRLSKRARQRLSVTFRTTTEGTATENTDYLRRSGGVVFAPGQRVRLGDVELIEDTVSDDGETVIAEIGGYEIKTMSGITFPIEDPNLITTARATGTINAPATSTTQIANLSIRINDTSARESAGWLVFAVRLSRAYSERVCYDFETLDTGTATPERDFGVRPTVTQWLEDGETEETSFVRIRQDSVNDGGETVKVKISNARLCNDASKTVNIARAQATGTIRNTDPIPKDWLARFGRTVASQAVDVISGRLEHEGGSHITVAGREFTPDDEAPAARSIAAWNQNFGGDAQRDAHAMLLGTAFQLAGADEGPGPGFAAWGSFAADTFEGRSGGVRVDGDVTSGFLGADVGNARWLAGAAVSLSRGEGSWTSTASDSDAGGDLESELASVYPYGQLALSETVKAWAMAGWGGGELTVTERLAGQEPGPAHVTGLSLVMGAFGVATEVISAEDRDGLGVKVKSDAFWARTASDAARSAHGHLGAAEADISRLRLRIETARRFALAAGAFTPAFELGARYDGGDAETGAGLEAGAKARYESARLSIEGGLHTLIAHQEFGYEEWSASASLQLSPGPNGRGLSASLAPSWGSPGSGTNRLWGVDDAQKLVEENHDVDMGRRLSAQIGYGLGFPSVPGTITPFASMMLRDNAGRVWRAGARWRLTDDASLSLEGVHAANGQGAGIDRGIRLQGSLRW
ncbi:MAG: hypothetical protein OXH68_19025 [Gammaproteobacteria bacterium]|nr:hypothetical protein [Gammaproteobacteria bacterium]